MALTPNQIVMLAIIAISLVVLVVVIYILNPFGWFGKPK
jgi:hypothetical protein